MGTSALYLCEAMKGREGALHVACDPNQDTQYRGIARANLQRVGRHAHAHKHKDMCLLLYLCKPTNDFKRDGGVLEAYRRLRG